MIFSYRSIVGLDFSEKELYYVELVRGVRGLRIGGFGVLDLSEGDMEIAHSRREIVVRKIKELLSSGKIKSKKVVIGLPREQYFFRKVSFPPVASEKLRPMIENQVERVFPIRSDQLIYDYQEIGKGRNGGREVILVGTRNVDVEEVMSITRSSGLELLRVDMREISLCNLLKMQEGVLNKPIMLLVVNERAAILVLLDEGHPIACRNIALEDDPIKMEDIIGEIERAITFYGEVSRGDRVNQLLISGTHPHLGRIFSETHRFFKGKVETLAKEEIALNFPEGFDLEKFVHPLGLALSGYQVSIHTLDLLPGKVREKRERDEWIRMGVISLVILFLVFAFSLASIWRDEARLEKVEREIAEIEGRVNTAQELKREFEDFARKVDTLNKLQAEKPHWLAILNNLSEAIPEDAWLTSLDMEQGEVIRISGHAASAAKLIPLLEDSPYLKNVKFEAPTTTRDFGGEEVETFRITADADWSGEDRSEAEQ